MVEKPVPQGAGAGDWTAKTQPFSVAMPSFAGPDLTEADMWGLTPLDQLWCRIQFRKARYEGPLTPASVQGSIVYPGFVGGIDWGSVSVDEARQIMVVNSYRMANLARFVPRAGAEKGKRARIPGVGRVEGSPYAGIYRPAFMSPLGVPCQRPPYGMIAAVDLATHRLLWSHPLGTARDAGPLGLRFPFSHPHGFAERRRNIVTKSGLIFIGATLDQ